MSRVIQDSDDELDDDLEVDVFPPEKEDASPKHSTSDTSSTVVVHGTRQKGKTPADFDSNSTSSEHFASKEVHITYGKIAAGILTSSPPCQQKHQDCLRQSLQPTGTTSEMDWVLDGTMREAYAQHNPNAMFPEPSSTVPNATLTQQRVLEGVLAPALLGSDIDPGRAAFQPDASIPWSEYLKSPTNTGDRPRSSAQEPHISRITSAAVSGLPLHELSAAPLSQHSRQGSSMLADSPLAHETCPIATDSQDITMFTENKDQSSDILSLTVDGPPQEELPGLRHLSRKRRPSPALTLDDDLTDLGVPKEHRSRSLKIGTQESIDYSIRPEKATKASKRRTSTPGTASLAKPLHTPEKIQQICDMGFTPSTSERALKRNKGDVTQSVDWLITNRIADDELVSHNSQMSEPGTHTRGQRVQIQTNHHGTEQTSMRNTAVNSAAVDHNAASAEADTINPLVHVRSPARVQVVIPTKAAGTFVDTPATMETIRKKAKRRKTTSDLPEPVATYSAVNEAKVEKKRGRGRPKKAIKAPVSTRIVQDDEHETSAGQARGPPRPPAFEDAQPTTPHGQATEHTTAAAAMKASNDFETFQLEDTTTGTVISKPIPGPPVIPDRPKVEPITPERIKKPEAREQPSNDRAKVSYRVGLSKRARITPLLRVMKK
ncbi:uncharacterized protein EKO05_0001369 [Ascochyta rabiei]|uniref:uncharacterized protein n=1 Tax=Didymella rabiei TaxID=5454 RepID=UPI002203ED3B|nr:uncharacterized protein EKO05_0001369 [Ascochyta rabiei]UPX10727.1 hypothetical protein EKO05_0001369 [Ascochyta rabiei]